MSVYIDMYIFVNQTLLCRAHLWQQNLLAVRQMCGHFKRIFAKNYGIFSTDYKDMALVLFWSRSHLDVRLTFYQCDATLRLPS